MNNMKHIWNINLRINLLKTVTKAAETINETIDYILIYIENMMYLLDKKKQNETTISILSNDQIKSFRFFCKLLNIHTHVFFHQNFHLFCMRYILLMIWFFITVCMCFSFCTSFVSIYKQKTITHITKYWEQWETIAINGREW